MRDDRERLLDVGYMRRIVRFFAKAKARRDHTLG